jgi:formyltetrahydrofolate deformylase
MKAVESAESARLYDLKIVCRDRPGIIAAIAGFIFNELSGNVLNLTHYTGEAENLFFFLVRFSTGQEARMAGLGSDPAFRVMTEEYGWTFRVYDLSVKPVVGVLVTQTDHCLYEILLKSRSGYLNAEIACILSNRDTLEPVAREFGLPFHYLPIEGDRAAQEAKVEALLREYRVETVALARYMQVLGAEFTRRWERRVINVHHGFLPAFKGARPYHRAWERGVKIIGATAHYATSDLDEGPILYQDVAPVRDNLSVKGFIEAGQDIERRVIVEGLKLHLEHRVFVYEGRTIIL